MMIKAGLSLQEIQFCEYFEKNLLDKIKATFDTIKTAGDILGQKVDTNCPACAKNAWLLLLNRYNQLLVEWERYKFERDLPISTKYEEEKIIEESKTIFKKTTKVK